MKLRALFAVVIMSLSLSSCGKSDKQKDITNDGVIDLYCINDYHGRVSQVHQDYHYEGGIARFATYLKNKVGDNPEGSVFLNAGDLWQDTYDSAMNRGELLTKAMGELNCEAMALGNHEFDWGLEQIRHNKSIADPYGFTFLGANIYNYNNGPTTQASDLASPYKIIERKGIKIGLIGGIGVNQITSITSTNWENITFLDPVPIVQQLSDKLRTEEDCQVIVYLYHGSLDNAEYLKLSKTSPVTDEPYVNVGFLGHTHNFESKLFSNNVAWLQSYQHGAVLGHIQLKVDKSGVDVTYFPDYENDSNYMIRQENGYGYQEGSIYASSEDPSIKALVDTYLTNEFTTKRDTRIGQLTNISGGDSIGMEFGGVQGYITNEYIKTLRATHAEIPEIDVVINNGVRDTIKLDSSCKLSYEDIYNLTPFTNKTIIATVKGADIKNECINYNNPYYLPGGALTLQNNKYYTVACIDYLLLHKSANRTYNFFPSYEESIYTIEDYPYDIISRYFEKGHSFDMSSLSSANYKGLSY